MIEDHNPMFSLINQTITKTLNQTKKMNPFSKNVVCPEPTEKIPVFPNEKNKMNIIVSYTSYMYNVEEVTYVDEIYNIVEAFMLMNAGRYKANNASRGNGLPSFTLYLNEKPLSRRRIPLVDFNIHDKSVIVLKYNFCMGGAKRQIKPITVNDIILPPYKIVTECEKQVLTEYETIVRDFTIKTQSLEFDHDKYMGSNATYKFAFTNFCRLTNKFSKLYGDNYIALLIEDVAFLYKFLTEAKDLRDIYFAIGSFIKFRNPGPLLRQENLDMIMDKATDIFGLFFDMKSQGLEEVVGALREGMDNLNELKESPLIKKGKQMAMYALSLGVFDRFGVTFDKLNYTKLEQEMLKRKYKPNADMLMILADTTLWLLERGIQCMKSGSLDPIYHSGSNYEKWFDKALELKRNSIFLNNPEDHGIDPFSYTADLKDHIASGDAIYKHGLRVGANDKKLVAATLNDLKMIDAHLHTKRSSMREREAPFSVLIYGGSSIAKSTFTKMLFYQYGKTFDLNTASEFKFIRNANANFWDGFNSSQWCVQLDDIAFMHPSCAAQGDPSVMEMLQVINNVPFVPDQASLEDKGRTPMKAKFVIATTNCENLNAYAYFQTPLAVQRRFPYVLDLRPKEEYLKDECMLDSSKVETVDGEWPDYWDIIVKRVVPSCLERNRQTAKLVDYCKFTDINEFLAWFSLTAIEHDNVQKQVKTCDNHMANIVVCKQCWKNTKICKCVTPQSDDIDTGFDFHNIRTPFRDHVVTQAAQPIIVECTFKDKVMFQLIHLLLYIMNTKIFHYSLQRLMSTRRFETWLENAVVDHPRKVDIMRKRYFYLGKRAKSYFNWKYDPEAIIGVLIMVVASFGLYRMVKQFRHDYKDTKDIPDMLKKMDKRQRLILLNRLQEQEDNGEPLSVGKAALHENLYAVKRAYTMTPYDAPHPYVKKHKVLGTMGIDLPQQDEPNLKVTTKEIGLQPVAPVEPEEENVWHNNDFELTSFDVSSTTASNRMDPEEFSNYIGKNVVFIETHRIDANASIKKREFVAFCVTGHIYVTAHHNLPSGSYTMKVVHGSSSNIGIQVISTQTHSDQFLRLPQYELTFFRLRCLPAKKNLMTYIAKPTANFIANGNYIRRLDNGTLITKSAKAIRRGGKLHCDMIDIEDSWQCVANPITEFGDCGMPMIANTNRGPIICGIHVAGSGDRALSTCLTTDIVDTALAHWEEPHIESGVPMLSAQGYPQVLVPLHRKSVMSYIPTGKCNIYGSLVGFRPSQDSDVEPTVIRDAVVSRGYQELFDKPKLGGWKSWRHAALDMTNPVEGIDENILSACVKAFKQDIKAKLPEGAWKEVQIYDDFTTMNGVPGLKFIDKINRKTSMGFPYKKNKKFFLEQVEPRGDVSDPMMYNDTVQARIDNMLANYHSGRRNMTVFCGQEKDEATKYSKIKDDKYRIFTGSPGDATHITRKYLLSVIRLIQKNKFVFECGPGTNSASLEWGEIYDYLTRFGEDHMIAGDYGKFDKTMPSNIILAAFDIIRWICQEAGYDHHALLVVQGIAEDTAFPLIDFKGDLVEFFGSNPSGHALTVIINGLANSLYMRYCYFVCNPEHEVQTFQQNVKLMTYGDDNVMGVSNCVPWFNHTALQNTLKEVGITYTMADKEAASVPYIHISEVSFLKRFWRWDEDVGAYLAPLEETSIAKSLTRVVASRTICAEQQAVEVMRSAHMEYFNYGYEIFSQKDKMFREIVTECGLEPYMPPKWFPSWQDYYDGFWRRSGKGPEIQGPI